jgi:hypothetical protein
MLNLRQVAIRSGLATALYLFGGLLLGFLVASWFSGLPMHMPQSANVLLSAGIALTSVGGFSALWGRTIARLCHLQQPRRIAWAAFVSFGPVLILAGFGLSALEVAIVERGHGVSLPLHWTFTLLFVPAVFLVTGVVGLVLGAVSGGRSLAWRSALGTGLAGGAAFLLVDLVLYGLGWEVGAPGAAQRATMLTVMFSGNLGASLAGGAVLGAILGDHESRNI